MKFNNNSLAGQTLTRGEESGQNSHHHLVSNTPRISWRVNGLVTNGGAQVAFFGMLFREGTVT